MCSFPWRKFPKIVGDLTSEEIFYRNCSLGAPGYVITFLFVSKQTLSKTIQLTPDCGKPTAINRNSVIDQFLTDLAPLSDREYSSSL